MKANLYNEEEQKTAPINEQQIAVADTKAEPVNAPKPTYYIVDYKALVKPTLIALIIFIIWALATWLL